MADLTIAELLARARAAQEEVAGWPQDDVDRMVLAAGWQAYDEKSARRLAGITCVETRLGVEQETCARQRKRILGTLLELRGALTSGFVEHIPERGLRKIAKPIGVIAAITPTTAPSAAVAQISLQALKTRNAVVFCPHPFAQRTASATVEVLQEGLRQAGAPRDLLQCMPRATRDDVQQLMSATDLILAAGGIGAVRRASSSGTPAYAAGVGNSVVILDETADVSRACGKIYAGKAFDNGTSCSAESCVLIAAAVWDAAIDELCRHGAYLCDARQMRLLRAIAWPDGGVVSRAVVGQHARTIARLAGFSVPEGTRVLLAVPDGRPGEDALGGEKLAPILSLWKYDDFSTAIEAAQALLRASGYGHSCGIHTKRPERTEQLAHSVNVSRILVNQSTGFGNSGDFTNGMPFTSVLCCGSWGGSISNENVTWRHLLNYTWVSEEIPDRTPEVEDIFGAHWARFGK